MTSAEAHASVQDPTVLPGSRCPAENTCFFASVNCASEGSGTTSAVARPYRTLRCFQPYGQEGLLVADLDLGAAAGLLASRCRPWSI